MDVDNIEEKKVDERVSVDKQLEESTSKNDNQTKKKEKFQIDNDTESERIGNGQLNDGANI